MHVLADRSALCDRGDHRLAEVLRMRAREADALDPLDSVAGAEQLAELGRDLGDEVTTPRVDVLAEQRHLAHAGVGKALHLGQDLAGASALLAAADGRHDAVRALGVAAHGDLHPRLERPLAVQRELGGELAVVEAEPPARDADAAGAEPFAQMGDRPRAERDVDRRVQLEDPLPLRLRVAAADGDHAVGILALPGRGLAEVRGQLQVGLLPDRARVEDDDVGVGRRRSLPQSELLEQALDPFAVVGVHLAAERRDVIPPHRRKGYPAATARPSGRSRARRLRRTAAAGARSSAPGPRASPPIARSSPGAGRARTGP